MVDAEKEKARARGRELAADYASRGDAFGWFDAFYEEAAGDISKVSWADLEPNRFFNAWAESRDLEGGGKRALVVGCGLGDDARYLHDLGFDVTAFDISPTAIEWAKRLHEGAGIAFFVADLLNAPPEWQQGFDFVLEIYTIQPLPMELRPRVIDAVASFVAPQGRLVVVCRGRGDYEEAVQMPWPLSRKDLSRFKEKGLAEIVFNEIWDAEEEQTKFVVEYERVE